MKAPSADAPPPTLRVGRALYYLFLALVAYIAVGHVFGDPFPFPVYEIAGGGVIGLALASQVWAWARWLRAKHARSSLAQRAVWTLAVCLFSYGFFRMIYFDPLPGLLGLVVLFSTLPVMLAASAWSISTSRDEVRRAAVFEGYAWGSFVGLGLIVAGIFAVRVSSAMSESLQAHALKVTSGMSPAAVGFGIGAIFSLVVFALCMSAGVGLWWLRKR
jgi:hypothetical protein